MRFLSFGRPNVAPSTTAPSARGHISKLLPFSCVDGPGSRLVVFFQGCNMDCGSCHNPHSVGHCNQCGDCAEVCPHNAITMRSDIRHCNSSLCQQCDSCIDQCPRRCNPTSQHYSVDELVKRIAGHAPLLDGVTFSGGEASLQHRFLLPLCDALAADPHTQQLSRLVDSNGLLAAAKWATLLPKIDGVMLDIKAIDEILHRKLTRRSNVQVLASAELLAEAGKLTELRWLIIEGLNDSSAEINAMIRFYRSLAQQPPLRLNAFHHHGVRHEFAQAHQPTSPERIDEIAQQLQQAGIVTTTVRVD
ncbi:YjjW family glycine radical enzyme activase [uncultured Ferrimonas sp.]|uniref:YjjW family glycine radical enzyme activase n=1 Tax=uncultured Ferrimonas sp. TaxID=432640 RepID=UPI0026026C8F|nr:YjjW family glycine radical enzyme activase [uncultured Ferrimonas sp.]